MCLAQTLTYSLPAAFSSTCWWLEARSAVCAPGWVAACTSNVRSTHCLALLPGTSEQTRTLQCRWRRRRLYLPSLGNEQHPGDREHVVATRRKPECVRGLVCAGGVTPGKGPACVCASLTARSSLGGPLLVPCPETIFSLPVCGGKGTAPGKLVCRLRAACPPSPGCVHGAALLGGKLQLWQRMSRSQHLTLNPFGSGSFTAYFWYFSHRFPDYCLPY